MAKKYSTHEIAKQISRTDRARNRYYDWREPEDRMRFDAENAVKESMMYENPNEKLPKNAPKLMQSPGFSDTPEGFKKGGKVKKYARGGGIESRGKTKGRFV